MSYESGCIDTADLLNSIDGLEKIADIHSETLFATGSENLGPRQWRILGQKVEYLTAKSNVDGIVITHGTDTLEEASFFLGLVCKSNKPVVLTAAMRPGNLLSADGPANLFHAVLAATSPELRHHGLIVVMNGMVIPGWQIIKTDSIALDSFHSYPGGTSVKIVGDRLLVSGPPNLSPILGKFNNYLKHDEDLPSVEILFLRGGFGDAPIDDFFGNDCKGLVIAGFGGGTIPEQLVEILTEKANSGCNIVISSRVMHVTVLLETMTVIKSENVFPSGFLNPQKSALLLALALDARLKSNEVAKLFKAFTNR